MSLGTLAHVLIMEPETPVHVKPAVDGRTKAGKEALAAFDLEVAGAPGLVVTATISGLQTRIERAPPL